MKFEQKIFGTFANKSQTLAELNREFANVGISVIIGLTDDTISFEGDENNINALKFFWHGFVTGMNFQTKNAPALMQKQLNGLLNPDQHNSN